MDDVLPDMVIEITFTEKTGKDRHVGLFAVKDSGEGLVPDIKNGEVLACSAVVPAGQTKCTIGWNSKFQFAMRVDELTLMHKGV